MCRFAALLQSNFLSYSFPWQSLAIPRSQATLKNKNTNVLAATKQRMARCLHQYGTELGRWFRTRHAHPDNILLQRFKNHHNAPSSPIVILTLQRLSLIKHVLVHSKHIMERLAKALIGIDYGTYFPTNFGDGCPKRVKHRAVSPGSYQVLFLKGSSES